MVTNSEEIITPTAPAPFDDPGADTILRSKEPAVDFFVMRAFLSYASLFFKDMFSIPQGDTLTRVVRDNKPIIPLDEDAETLELMLTYCYPLWMRSSDREQPTLEQLLKARTAAEKYQMDGVDSRIRGELVAERFLAEQPLRIYAIALSLNLERETRLAAKATLRIPILGHQYYEELELITGGAHHRLQMYHVKCAEVAKKVATNLEWIEERKSIWFDCITEQTVSTVQISRRRAFYVRAKWWWEYLSESAAALAEKPSGTTVMDPQLINNALIKASACGSCRHRALKELREFAENFAAQVDRAMAEIELEVEIPRQRNKIQTL